MEAALDTRISRGLTGDLDAHMQYSAAEALRQGGEASGAMGAGLGAGMGMAMASQMQNPWARNAPQSAPMTPPASAPRRTRLAHRRQGPDDGAVFKGGHGENGG